MTETDRSFYEKELEHLSVALLRTIHFRAALCMSLFVISLAFAGAAFISHKAALFLLGGSVLFLLIGADFTLIRSIYGYYYLAIQILNKLGIEEETHFDMSMIFITFSKMKEIHSVANKIDTRERYRALRKLPLTIPTFLGFFAPIITVIIQFTVCWYTWCILGWSF